MREILLLPQRVPELERWDVERLPLGAEIERRTGFDRVYRTASLGGLATTLGRSKTLHFLGPIAPASAPVPPALELYGRITRRVPGTSIKDDSALLPSLRIVKEPREIELIRRATAATRRGHLAAMRQVKPGWTERQLKTLVESEFRAGGGDGKRVIARARPDGVATIRPVTCDETVIRLSGAPRLFRHRARPA